MVECPVCGRAPSPGQTACAVCGLPTKFFEPLLEATDPVASAGVTAATEEVDESGQGLNLKPSQPETPVSLSTLVAGTGPEDRLRASESAVPDEAPGATKDAPEPDDEVLRIGRSLGVNVSKFDKIPPSAQPGGTLAQRPRIRRELISTVLDGLLDRYRALCERRDVLSTVMRTRPLDEKLSEYRRALSKGELARADELRQDAQRAVEALEASLSRIRTRLAEASQMMRALQELGGVAPKVLRPVAEAVRAPQRAEADQVERRLSQTNGFLWGLLVPRMNHEISRGLTLLDQTAAPASKTAPIRVEIDRMVEQIQSRKISEALESHRFLRVELASLTPRARRKTSAHFSIDEVHPS
jgi:hypothetical protein